MDNKTRGKDRGTRQRQTRSTPQGRVLVGPRTGDGSEAGHGSETLRDLLEESSHLGCSLGSHGSQIVQAGQFPVYLTSWQGTLINRKGATSDSGSGRNCCFLNLRLFLCIATSVVQLCPWRSSSPSHSTQHKISPWTRPYRHSIPVSYSYTPDSHHPPDSPRSSHTTGRSSRLPLSYRLPPTPSQFGGLSSHPLSPLHTLHPTSSSLPFSGHTSLVRTCGAPSSLPTHTSALSFLLLFVHTIAY